MSQQVIVADESVDFRIVGHLREVGYDVYSITEQNPSIADIEVLNIAVEKQALLITEDKDFGELVFRLQLPHTGILLIRILSLPTDEKLKSVAQAIGNNLALIKSSFSVLSDTILRIRQ